MKKGKITRKPVKPKKGKPPIPPPPVSRKPPIPVKTVVPVFVPPWESGFAGPKVGYQDSEAFNPYNWDHVPEHVKVKRRLFAAEYLKDFNGTAALMRMGFEFEHPASTASRWLKEPYTQYIIDKYTDDAAEETLISRQKIIAGLIREANHYGLDSSGAARVAAFGKLAKIKGMEITKIEGKVELAGGIMQVPLGNNPADWEKNAAASQAALKAGAAA